MSDYWLGIIIGYAVGTVTSFAVFAALVGGRCRR